VGLVNGLVVTRFNIDSFIVTLGTASLILGIVNWYSEGNSIVQGIPQSVISFGGGLTFGIPNLVFVLAAGRLRRLVPARADAVRPQPARDRVEQGRLAPGRHPGRARHLPGLRAVRHVRRPGRRAAPGPRPAPATRRSARPSR
jgi:hypothetical protein